MHQVADALDLLALRFIYVPNICTLHFICVLYQHSTLALYGVAARNTHGPGRLLQAKKITKNHKKLRNFFFFLCALVCYE